LAGDLEIPAGANAVVLFAHGSGSSRHSPRNQFVARTLQSRGLATLLIDLLTPAEEARDRMTAELRFDISLLANRLTGIIDWMGTQPALAELPTGLFGASTGAGAALVAAAARPDRVAAVVSRGGRPDLAGEALPKVKAPTLLLVGGYDEPVLDLNHLAMRSMRASVKLVIVPGASHLFEEPGALDEVARQAAEWFLERAAAHKCRATAATSSADPSTTLVR
jgi:pimeloyl-ACP methyl ester carboxylesterase